MAKNEDSDWASILGGLQDSQTKYPALNYLSGLTVPLTPTVEPPFNTRSHKIQEAKDRFEKRLDKLRGLLPIRAGRTIPDDDDLLIGDAKRLKLAVLFLDICKFSRIPNDEPVEQDNVLKLLNLFMAEMLQVVKMHGGEFEKNTGDGLMAYFGEEPEAEITKRAVDAAVTMHCYNDQVISPKLEAMGLEKVRFRVGIETGTVTIANVGIHGGRHRSLVAIGTTANVACKLMTLIPDGGIVIGNYTKSLLPEGWKIQTTPLGALPGFKSKGTSNPYPAWEVKIQGS